MNGEPTMSKRPMELLFGEDSDIVKERYPEDKTDEHIVPKITKCTGEGQGSCKRCSDNGKWNRNWMSMLYKIEGLDGCYCSDCVKEITGHSQTASCHRTLIEEQLMNEGLI